MNVLKEAFSLKTWLNILKTLFLGLFTVLMFQIIWPYTSWELDVDFLLTKQEFIHLGYYKAAFYIHIFSSLVVLGSGIILFSKTVLRKMPRLHRITGKTYVGLVLLLSAPSGLIMGFFANGGWAAQLSFILLSPIWWWFTWKGYTTIRSGDIAAHRIWMYRSYAISLSAITLRIGQLILNTWGYFDPEMQYVFLSWSSWIINLVILKTYFYWGIMKKNTSYKFDFQKKMI